MRRVIGIQTSVLVWDPEVACELTLARLGHSLEATGEYSFGQSPTDESLCKSRSPTDKFHHTVRAKKIKFGCIEEVKRNSFALPLSPLPQGRVTQCQERPSWPTVSPMDEGESV